MAGMGGHLAPEWGVTMLRNIQEEQTIWFWVHNGSSSKEYYHTGSL